MKNNKKYSNLLAQIHREDKRDLQDFSSGTLTFNDWERRARDRAHALEMLVTAEGFPYMNEVGSELYNRVISVLLHLPPLEMEEFFKKYIEHAESKQVTAEHKGMITDKILTLQGKKQLYGTQFHYINDEISFLPIKDSSRLDIRRKKLGMTPHAEYKDKILQEYLKR